MRRWLIVILLVMLASVLGATGSHRHAPGESKAPCGVCTFAHQGVTPAAPQSAEFHPPNAHRLLELTAAGVHAIDGRELYRSAPKSSPPAKNA